MDTAYISGLSALAGSVVGGLTSGVSALMTQRSQAKADLLVRDMSRREDLYRDFIVAASRAYGKAVLSSEPDIEALIALYGMISRMRVISSRHVVECADNVMHKTLETYSAPNKTVGELNEWMRNGIGIDPLKEFSEAAREELRITART